jgi:hypothetical protein
MAAEFNSEAHYHRSSGACQPWQTSIAGVIRPAGARQLAGNINTALINGAHGLAVLRPSTSGAINSAYVAAWRH